VDGIPFVLGGRDGWHRFESIQPPPQHGRVELRGLHDLLTVGALRKHVNYDDAIGMVQLDHGLQPDRLQLEFAGRSPMWKSKLRTPPKPCRRRPESKFNFSPENLHIAGGDYKDVRTFALQIRHIAASNYAIWSALTGDQFPKDFLGGNGPENLNDQSCNPEIPEGFFCPGPQSGFYVDAGEHAAAAGAQQIDPPAPGRLWRRTRL
jgi:hypothetical protein